jgi:hypothetical protein
MKGVVVAFVTFVNSGNSAPDSSPEVDILVGFQMIKTRRKILPTASTATKILTICPIGKALRYNQLSMRHISPLSEV